MNNNNPLLPLRELKLSDKEKKFIRTNILASQRKSLFLRKVFFVSRITGYVAVSTFGIFVLVSSYLPQSLTPPSEEGELFSVTTNDQAIVKADTIGHLLEIQGVVHVIKNGAIIPKTDIAAGEIVILQPGAELIVQVRATTFAKITGPAKFVLEYIPEIDQTVLNLLEGKLIEVTTKITTIIAQKNTPLENEETTAPGDSVVIKTKFVEVTPHRDQTTTFVIEQEDKAAEVIAKSGNILVKQLIDHTNNPDADEALLVDAGETAHIDTKGIAIYVPKNENEAVQLARESKALQIRYETPPSSENKEQIAALLVTETAHEEESALLSAVEVGADILDELSKKAIGTTEKEILTPELLQSLTQALHPNISAQNISQMRKRKGENIDAYIIAYSNLLEQINRAYTLLGIPQPVTSTNSLDAGIQITQNLLSLLESTYSTPPSLRNSLASIIIGLSSLQKQEHNAAEETPPGNELGAEIVGQEDKGDITTVIDELKKITE